MPHDIRLISLDDFLRTDVHGQFDMAATKQLLAELSKEVAQHPHHDILLDLRDARSHLVVPELYALVAHLSELGLGVNNRMLPDVSIATMRRFGLATSGRRTRPGISPTRFGNRRFGRA